MTKGKKTATEKEFEDAITSFHYKMVGKFQEEARKLGYTVSQLEILRYVSQEKNPTMKEIAKHLGITPPSVTIAIETLCKKGLLKREFEKGDRRIVRIIFTPKTCKFFSSFKEKRLAILKNVFSGLTIEEKGTLVKIINKLI